MTHPYILCLRVSLSLARSLPVAVCLSASASKWTIFFEAIPLLSCVGCFGFRKAKRRGKRKRKEQDSINLLQKIKTRISQHFTDTCGDGPHKTQLAGISTTKWTIRCQSLKRGLVSSLLICMMTGQTKLNAQESAQ